MQHFMRMQAKEITRIPALSLWRNRYIRSYFQFDVAHIAHPLCCTKNHAKTAALRGHFQPILGRSTPLYRARAAK